MSRKREQGGRSKPNVTLVFGEDLNDSKSISKLIQALSPTAPNPLPRRDPPIYIKNASLDKIRKNAGQIAAVVEAEQVRHQVNAVFVHQDCDAIEPAHEDVAAQLEQALSQAGIGNAHAVAPAWEMEAWWFLWPDAVSETRKAWRRPDDYVGRDVGRIRNAKEALQRAVRPRKLKKGHRFEGYSERDAPLIADQVKALGCVGSPSAKSKSFDRFVKSVHAAFDS